MLPDTAGAESVTVRNAVGLADVFACVRVLVDGAIMAPLHVHRRTLRGRERVSGGRAVRLIDSPAPGVTQPAFVAQLVASLALWGEAFIGKYREGEEIVQLGALPPDRMVVEVERGEPGYTYYSPDGQVNENLTREDVIHVRGLSLDGVRGASPISLCREAIGLSTALTQHASALWANGAVPVGLLRVPGGAQGDEQASNLAKAWKERHGGPKAAGRVAVVSGEVNWQPVSMPLVDAEFVESRKLSTADIARILRVPTWMIGAPSGDSLTYSNTESQAAAFVKFSLGPWLRLIEEALSADPDLFLANTYCRFNLEGLLRADSGARAAFYSAALNEQTGWMTRAEVRELEDLPREETNGTRTANRDR